MAKGLSVRVALSGSTRRTTSVRRSQEQAWRRAPALQLGRSTRSLSPEDHFLDPLAKKKNLPPDLAAHVPELY
jgi:hypothetical protein